MLVHVFICLKNSRKGSAKAMGLVVFYFGGGGLWQGVGTRSSVHFLIAFLDRKEHKHTIHPEHHHLHSLHKIIHLYYSEFDSKLWLFRQVLGLGNVWGWAMLQFLGQIEMLGYNLANTSDFL